MPHTRRMRRRIKRLTVSKRIAFRSVIPVERPGFNEWGQYIVDELRRMKAKDIKNAQAFGNILNQEYETKRQGKIVWP